MSKFIYKGINIFEVANVTRKWLTAVHKNIVPYL